MIFVSSSCVRARKIAESVKTLSEAGFKNVELSGGTNLYEGFEEELLELKAKYGLTYLCHNYFPPPREHFVLNLASLNADTYERSLSHLRSALTLTAKFGASRFAFHAGFLIDIATDEVGKRIKRKELFDRSRAVDRFCESLNLLKREFPEVQLYVENNVLSAENLSSYGGDNPLLFTDPQSYRELKAKAEFRPLIDVAHLKVSASSLRLDFDRALDALMPETDYLHFSDNNGLADENRCILPGSSLFKTLTRFPLRRYTITLEYYDELSRVRECHDELLEAIEQAR